MVHFTFDKPHETMAPDKTAMRFNTRMLVSVFLVNSSNDTSNPSARYNVFFSGDLPINAVTQYAIGIARKYPPHSDTLHKLFEESRKNKSHKRYKPKNTTKKIQFLFFITCNI